MAHLIHVTRQGRSLPFVLSTNLTLCYCILLLVFGTVSSIYGQDDRPNILWISTEDISPAWGCYGDALAHTPNIDAIAKDGYIFSNASSNAPICAPARSTLITGMYATSLGTQNLRSVVPLSDGLQTLPEYMKSEGYFTTNNVKTDYNFSAEGRWDELSSEAHWRNNPGDGPFYSVFNFMITHEGHVNHPRPEEDTDHLMKKQDPDRMHVPPFFPDNDEFRQIMALQYDLITVFDEEVGRIITELKEDGLFDNTIIFIFSDHGYGLPRYKRWLNSTGLEIPFVLHVPDKYKHLVQHLRRGVNDFKVDFVDFAPTVLNVAGASIPETMEGSAFMGSSVEEKPYSFGYRDRADDAYEVSRSVYDGQYLFVRNYMPHQPYVQDVLIFKEDKWSYKALFEARDNGTLPVPGQKMFEPKPLLELYDLQADSLGLINLASKLPNKVAELQGVLRQHIINTHDTGFMNEGHMMVSGRKQGVYAYARKFFDIENALEAAEQVGQISDEDDLITLLSDDDPNVRFWGLIACQSFEQELDKVKMQLSKMLTDPSKPNRFIAARLLIETGEKNLVDQGYTTLSNAISDEEDEVLQLQLAIEVRNLGGSARPLIKGIQSTLYPKIAGDIWGRYKTWMYPMFTGMALDQTLVNCGLSYE